MDTDKKEHLLGWHMGRRGECVADDEMGPKLLMCMDGNKCQSVVIAKTADYVLLRAEIKTGRGKAAFAGLRLPQRHSFPSHNPCNTVSLGT